MRFTLPGVLITVCSSRNVVSLLRSEFDKDKCMDLKGTFTGIDWENPHAYLHMDVKDPNGKTASWSLEMITPLGMKRSGTTRDNFLNNIGKPIAARACPTKAGGTQYRGQRNSSS